ncbi:cytochrome ubiquinol oxidase subunit I [bacterium]|nr:cytochrome ubiquinol oxidase subunit I [bacterium]
MDAEILARLQFAFTAGFHYIFPPISIGLGVILIIMEGMYLKTGNEMYEQMTKFWVKIFGLVFAIGVASGIVLEFEFGTNWSNYSRYVGDVFGSALAAEGVFAFFLESGFLAILLFGWDKVSKKMHFISTVLVAFGAHFSAIWIIVANSWQQTPAGHHIVQEAGRVRAEIVDFWAVVFNPSTLDRLSHTIMGAWQAGAWIVISVSAYYLLKKRHVEISKTAMKIAVVIALVASIGQLVTGHSSGVTVAETQPAKLAAFEGQYETEVADLAIIGWVDEGNEKVIGIKFPKMLSWLIYGDTTTPVTGLNEFAEEDRPPVQITFQAYHFMVALGMLLILLAVVFAVGTWRGFIFEQPWLLKIGIVAVILPMISNQLGWIAAEVGRQPWVVYNLLRTSEGLSPEVSAGQVLGSLIGFVLIYALLFALFIFLFDSKIKHGPEEPWRQMEGKRA